MAQPNDTPGLAPEDLIRAAAAALDRIDKPFYFMASGSDQESTQIVLGALLIPTVRADLFMPRWVRQSVKIARAHGIDSVVPSPERQRVQ